MGGEEGECESHDTLPPEAGECAVDDSVAGESHSETNRDWQKEATYTHHTLTVRTRRRRSSKSSSSVSVPSYQGSNNMSLPKRARGVLSRSGKKRGVSHDVGTFYTLVCRRFLFCLL